LLPDVSLRHVSRIGQLLFPSRLVTSNMITFTPRAENVPGFQLDPTFIKVTEGVSPPCDHQTPFQGSPLCRDRFDPDVSRAAERGL